MAREASSLVARRGGGGGGAAAGALLCCCTAHQSPNVSPRGGVRPGSPSDPQGAEAARIFATFCEEVPVARVLPTEAELEALWSRCAKFRPTVIAKALSAQFSRLLEPALDVYAWHSHARALQALIFFYGKGKAGRLVGDAAMEQSSELVHHLARDMPECADAAARALEVWQLAAVAPAGCEAQAVGDDGLLQFTKQAGSLCCQGADSAAPAPLLAAPPRLAPAQAAAQAEPPCSAAAAPSAIEEDLLCLAADAAPVGSPPAATVLPLAAPAPPAGACLAEHARRQHHEPPSGLTAAAGCGAGLLLELGPLALEIGRALEVSPAAPQIFNMSDAESLPADSSELNEMFSFVHKDPILFPALTKKYLSENIPEAKDPFAFVADHMWQQ